MPVPDSNSDPLARWRRALTGRLSQVPGRMRAPMRGQRPPMTVKFAVWSFLSGTFGILAIIWITELAGTPLLIGSFGATAVLLFGAHDSPLAQPRNLVGGHVLSAVVAVLVVALVGSTPITTAVAVGLSLLVMNLTHTTHPPGGATALIGVQASAGPEFVLVPVLAGALILLAVALLTNNFVHHRRYPAHWL
jgi:CBS-domain-containing membrane protein